MVKENILDAPGGVCLYAPFGGIGTVSNFASALLAPPAVPADLPVMWGKFSETLTAADTAVSKGTGKFGWTVIESGAVQMLVLCIHTADNAFVWLANPHDPNVWAMLDEWHHANTIVVGVQVDDHRCQLTRGGFSISEAMMDVRPSRFRQHETFHAAMSFVKEAALLLLSGTLPELARDVMPPLSECSNIRGCTVATRTTGRIPVHHTIAPWVLCELVTAPWEQSHRAIPELAS